VIKEILLKKAKGLPVVEKPEGLRKFVDCKIGNLRFFIEMESVRELAPLVSITNIPGADYNILGVLNLRGEIVVVIDLREKFKISEVKKTILSRIVIVNVEGELIGIFVDEASNIVEVTKEQFIDSPKRAEPFYLEYIDIEGEEIGVLDLKKIYLDYKIK
jgi:purine-binding chemotaxis protein CheW